MKKKFKIIEAQIYLRLDLSMKKDTIIITHETSILPFNSSTHSYSKTFELISKTFKLAVILLQITFSSILFKMVGRRNVVTIFVTINMIYSENDSIGK